MKTIVIYYSKSGNNQYLAEKITKELACDIESLRPKINVFLLLILKIGFGNKKLIHHLAEYDRVILCGPVWMGSLIYPLKSFLKRHIKEIKKLIFATCCSSTFETKDDKCGYNRVFNIVKEIAGEKCTYCEVFPIQLAMPQEKRSDGEALMKAHLSDDNFTGEIQEHFEKFLTKVV